MTTNDLAQVGTQLRTARAEVERITKIAKDLAREAYAQKTVSIRYLAHLLGVTEKTMGDWLWKS